MEKVKNSFITTVYNEEASIISFLESLFNQSKLPDEVIVVDGGSSDSTVARIKNYELRIKNFRGKFIIIQKKGNRAVGRNEAIKRATGSIIVCSDAGCILDKNWLENITRPFKDPNVDVVAGYYLPIAKTPFQKALATYTCVMPDKVDPKAFLPSSRSIAFKKSAWKNVGGYPEEFSTCEDLVFAKRLKEKGLLCHFVKDALVYWPQKENVKNAFVQFFNYAKGDGEAHYFRPQTPFLFLRYVCGLVLILILFKTQNAQFLIMLIILLFFYLVLAYKKNKTYVSSSRAIYLLPILQLTADVAVVSGTTIGFIKSLLR